MTQAFTIPFHCYFLTKNLAMTLVSISADAKLYMQIFAGSFRISIFGCDIYIPMNQSFRPHTAQDSNLKFKFQACITLNTKIYLAICDIQDPFFFFNCQNCFVLELNICFPIRRFKRCTLQSIMALKTFMLYLLCKLILNYLLCCYNTFWVVNFNYTLTQINCNYL